MDCGRISDQLGFYVDGVLDEHSMEVVEKHLATCATCRDELAALRMLIGAAGEIEAVEPPVDLRARIAAATTEKRKTAAVRPGFVARLQQMLSPRSIALAGGLACAIVTVGVFVAHIPAGESVSRTAFKVHTPAPAADSAKPVMGTPAPATVASAAPSAAVSHETRPARFSKTRLIHRTRDASTVAVLPKTDHSVESKTNSDMKTKNVTKLDTGETVAQMDTTTCVETVAYAKTQSPAPEAVDKSPKKLRSDLIKVAASPVLQQSETEEWLKEMKTQAAMHGRGRGSNVVSVINAKF